MFEKTIRYRGVFFVLGLVITLGYATNSSAASSPYWASSGQIPIPTPMSESALSAGLSITLNKGDALSANLQASAAFDLAAIYISSWIADPVTLTLNVDLGSLEGNKLGSGNPIETTSGYSNISSKLAADQATYGIAGDITDSLPENLVTALPPGFTVQDNLSISRANAKALGFDLIFLPGGPGGSDGTIIIDDGFNWDYDPVNGIDDMKFDFFGVAVHEIIHLMGFYSAVDLVDASVSGIALNTLDLFRIAPGAGCDNFSGSTRQLTPDTNPVTYLGECIDAAMSTGDSGDGNSASHWKAGLGLGLLDPTFAPGEATLISTADVRALDLIGWDVDPNFASSAVPIPAAVWMMMSGLGLLGFVARKRNCVEI